MEEFSRFYDTRIPHLYASNYRENFKNTQYPHKMAIICFDDLKKVVTRDHIAAAMKDNHRANDNFLMSDCIQLDLDNTHSEDPEEWQTIDDIIDAFPDVRFYYICSRNHMKVKTKTSSTGTVTTYAPREKYHIYFPLSSVYTDYNEYEALLLKAAGLFPYFDIAAAKPAQFFAGVQESAGGEEEGSTCLDQYINTLSPNAITEAFEDFEKKIKDGTYTRAGDKEYAEARRKLYAYLGLSLPPDTPQNGAGAPNTDDASDTEQYSTLGLKIGRAEQRNRYNWFKEWAAAHGVQLGREYTIKSREHPEAICICVTCPWEEEHSMNGADNETVVIIELGGKMCFLCRHSHGGRYGWKDYRAYYEKRDALQEEPTADTEVVLDTAAQEGEQPQLKGLLTAELAMQILASADDNYIEMPSFPRLSSTLKLRTHDTVVIAADTGAGKSSLALNILNDIQDMYPSMYINLEMDSKTVLQRLVAIHTGIDLDMIGGYKHDDSIRKAVDAAIREITARREIQLLEDVYDLDKIEAQIQAATKGREEPTIVFIDTGLLVTLPNKSASRYERFTQISERLRRISRLNNIVMFVLLQQNRESKKGDTKKRPTNDSLKESGSWENDATKIIFLWDNPDTRSRELAITKNRSGRIDDIALNYSPCNQTYWEKSNQTRQSRPRVI